MSETLYRFLSYVLSPPAFAFYATIMFSILSPIGSGSINAISSIMIGSFFLFLVPVFSVFYFSKEDIEVSKKENRTKIYVISVLSYLTSAIIFWILNSHVMFVISVAYIFVGSAVSLINIFWKISAHTSGSAGPITALVYVFGIDLIPVYSLVFLISFVRFKMKAHNFSQLIIGALVAILITFVVYKVLW